MQLSDPLHKFPAALWSYVNRPEVIPILVTILLGMFCRVPLLATGFSIIVVLVSLLVCQKMSATTSQEMPRYIVPILLPAALFLAAMVRGNPLRALAPAATLAIFMIIGNSNAMMLDLRARTIGLPSQLQITTHLHPDDPNCPGAYAAGLRGLQDLTPAGARILSVIDHPYLMDFRRNEIFAIDCVGAAAPGGGIPFFEGKDRLAAYLQGQGIQYVLCMDFDKALLLYNRQLWKNHPGNQWYYRAIWAPRFLDFMDNVDSIGDWGGIVGTFANMRMIRLPAAVNTPIGSQNSP